MTINKQYYITAILLFNAFLFTFSAGINAVSFPFVLYDHNVSTSLIGVAQAAEILAGVLIAKFVYNISKKFGAFKLVIILSIFEAIIFLILPFYQSFILWLALVFISGLCWFIIITVRQSWMNLTTDDSKRSLLMAINSTVLCVGFALGPIVVKIIGAGKYPVFVVSAVLVLASCLFLLLAQDHQPKLEKEEIDYKKIIKENFNTFLGRFFLDFQVVVVILFTVIYGVKEGLSAEDSGILVSVFMAVALFDILIGFLIKHKPHPNYINIGFAGTLISILFLPFAMPNYYLAMIIFIVYGWFVSLVFIALITKANSASNHHDLIAINSCFQAGGALGALCGTLLAGVFMEVFDNNGFVLIIILANIGYFLTKFFKNG